MKNFVFINLFLLISSPFIANAQVANKAPDRMKMLTAFNGEWKGEMVNIIEKKKIKYKLSHTSEKIAGGWGIQLNEIAMIPDKGKYVATRIFSYSPTGDTTYMYTIDNFGQTFFYTGVWETPKRLLLKNSREIDGKKTDRIISYYFQSPKEYDYSSVIKSEGKTDEVLELKMVRQ
jgi:hypothetical protein